MYNFEKYSEEQKRNWSKSKRIVIYENQEQYCGFINKSLSDGTYDKKMYFGKISSDQANSIFDKTGLMIEGYNCSISSSEIRKIRNSHGNDMIESMRGQRGFTVSDYLILPIIILSYDSVELSVKTHRGNPVLVFQKEIGNDSFHIVGVVTRKHMDIFIQTSWINKKRNLSAPIAE